MITAIVRRVQQILAGSGRSDVDVEVVFPVASEAITTAQRAGEVQATVRAAAAAVMLRWRYLCITSVENTTLATAFEA